MGELIDISEVFDKKGKVVIRGWVHHKRSSGGILFIIVRDGTATIQCTLRKDKFDPKVFEAMDKLPVESVIEVEGTVREDPRSPGGYEIGVEDVKITHKAQEDFPIGKKYHGPDFLLDHRHLWLRSRKMQAVLRIRSEFLKAVRAWFDSHGFTEFQSPIFTAAACEGGSTLFSVKYFDQTVYLTQSWQLYAEAAISSVGKIYTVAPSFRAEKSRTRRHLTEYWHIEAEMPWYDLKNLIGDIEDLIISACHHLARATPRDLKECGRDPDYLLKINKPLPRVTYDEVVEMLNEGKRKIKWGEELDWSHEKFLSQKFDVPFFITHFPKKAKAFYHKPDPERPDVTLSTDLEAPGGYGELVGAGQRIHDIDEMLARIKEEGLNPKDYQWYIDLRRWGSVPHAGFGLGLERVVMWICKLKHIRDAIAFPRLLRRVYP